MKRLAGLDATFLHLENANQFGHVAGLSIFARPSTPGYDPHAQWRGQLEGRLHLLEPLRRRLVEVPLGIDHPVWINDPDFDLDFHVRHSAVPPPGGDDQLANTVARLVSHPLDRSRPLWLSYVIEGLDDERFAVLTIVHHAAVDGASGVELLTLMLDEQPGGGEVAQPAREWRTEPVPSDLKMLLDATVGLVRKPARAVLLAARTAREIGEATRNPVLVAAANQVRGTLRGPLGAVLNIGRDRGEERDTAPPPSCPRCAHRARRSTPRSPRIASSRSARRRSIRSRRSRPRWA